VAALQLALSVQYGFARNQGVLIKTLLAAETAAFDPQVVRIITVAFEEAWELLTQADSTLAKRRPAATRERLAKRIIELARHGERDPRRLRDSAVLFITQSSLKSLPRRPGSG
jgi:hypothetical protein